MNTNLLSSCFSVPHFIFQMYFYADCLICNLRTLSLNLQGSTLIQTTDEVKLLKNNKAKNLMTYLKLY